MLAFKSSRFFINSPIQSTFYIGVFERRKIERAIEEWFKMWRDLLCKYIARLKRHNPKAISAKALMIICNDSKVTSKIFYTFNSDSKIFSIINKDIYSPQGSIRHNRIESILFISIKHRA